MKLDEDTLIEQLKLFARTGMSPGASGVRRSRKPAPPVTEAEMLEAEAKLGFPLPPLLRRLYLEVSNGAFGPGLLPLSEKQADKHEGYPESLVAWYLAERSETQEELDAFWQEERDANPPEEFEAAWGDWDNRPMVWPEKLLTVADWGCNIYSCIDCSKPECPVLRHDSNISFRTFALEAPSLHEWLESGLDGKELFWLDWDQAEKVTFPLG